ncbi:cupin domain-containing protein [Pseudomonadota bacterium AL_CKDN230030165-1A_HGKHYDSX7]
MTDTASARLIDSLGLQPHPEGGHFRETYRAATRVTRADGVVRDAATAILYLLSDGAWSAWHRIQSDETWHFHAGQGLHVHVLTADGTLITHHLGNPLERPGAVFQATVPGGCWFAAELSPDTAGTSGAYALAGCTVAPGFEFSEFELADPTRLAQAHPEHAALIHRLAPRG